MQIIEKFDIEKEYYTEERCYITELYNNGESSIARARVKPGVTTGLHSLNNTFEQYVIIEGEAEVEVGDSPATKVGLFDVVSIAAGIPQKIRNTGTVDLVFLCLCTPGFKQEAYQNLE